MVMNPELTHLQCLQEPKNIFKIKIYILDRLVKIERKLNYAMYTSIFLFKIVIHNFVDL